jgi:hypothetical protein
VQATTWQLGDVADVTDADDDVADGGAAVVT